MEGLCLPIRGPGWEALVSGKQCLILPKQSPRQRRVPAEIRMKGQAGGCQTQQVTLLPGLCCQIKTNNAGKSLCMEWWWWWWWEGVGVGGWVMR